MLCMMAAIRRSPLGSGTLLLLLLLFGSATADRLLTQQSSSDVCKRIHPQCLGCAKGAGATSLVCTSCTPVRYSLVNGTCACAPGYHGPSCQACNLDTWCAGADAAPKQCGPCLGTQGFSARSSQAQCLTKPGCGMLPTVGTAETCPVSSYSIGGSKEACQRCPSGLVTAAEGSTSIDKCASPAGYLFKAMRAVPCPVGSFKTGISRASSCTACPAGLTTSGLASTSLAQCNKAAAGRMPVQDGSSIRAVPCPVGSYSPDGKACIQCPDGLLTQSAGSKALSECLAPPGFGWYKNGVGDNNPISTDDLKMAGSYVVQCRGGSFKAGWSLHRCTPCGKNVQTDTTSTNGLGLGPELCFIPAGWGTVYDPAARQLVASRCGNGTFGPSEAVYGLGAAPCQLCPYNMATPDQVPADAATNQAPAPADSVFTSVEQCVTKPGYGFDGAAAYECPADTYSEGYTREECSRCGDNLHTTDTGATSPAACLARAGWFKWTPRDSTSLPCPTGSFSAVGATKFTECPLGTTTEGPESTTISQCNVCAAGFGFDGASSECTICTEGFFAPGGSLGACSPCGSGQSSRVGSTSAVDCFTEFLPLLPGSVINTPASAWTRVALNATTAASAANSCQDACHAEPRCQYWWHAPSSGCSLKLAAESPAADAYVAIKLTTDSYTIWQAAADEYELQAQRAQPMALLTGAAEDPWQCLTACDNAAAACWGVFITKATGTWQCWSLQLAAADSSSTGGVKVTLSQVDTYYWDMPKAGPLQLPRNRPSPDVVPASSPQLPVGPQYPAPPQAPNQGLTASPQSTLSSTPTAIADNGKGCGYTAVASPTGFSGGVPTAIDVDGNNTVILAHDYSYMVWKIQGGQKVPFAGTGKSGFAGDGSLATSALLNKPQDVAYDPDTQSVYIADTGNCRIRKVGQDGIISTIAGGRCEGYASHTGTALSANLESPNKVAVGPKGSVLFAAQYPSYCLYSIQDGVISQIAACQLWPAALAYDKRSGLLVVADRKSNRVLRLNMTTGAVQSQHVVPYSMPKDMVIDNAGNILVLDQYSQHIARLDVQSGQWDTVAGVGYFQRSVPRSGGIPATMASVAPDSTIAMSVDGTLFATGVDGYFLTMTPNCSVNSSVTNPAPSLSIYAGLPKAGTVVQTSCLGSAYKTVTIAGGGGLLTDDVLARNAWLNYPGAIALTADSDIIVADRVGNKIFKINRSTWRMSRVAGTGANGNTFDTNSLYREGGQARETAIPSVTAVACNKATGDIFFSTEDARIMMVDGKSGVITTVAGTAKWAPQAPPDGATAVTSALGDVRTLDVNPKDGALYYFDRTMRSVRRINARGLLETVPGSNTTEAVAVDSISFDKAGNLLMGGYNSPLRRLNIATGAVESYTVDRNAMSAAWNPTTSTTLVAGGTGIWQINSDKSVKLIAGGQISSPMIEDNVSATSAHFHGLWRIVVGDDGVIYGTDTFRVFAVYCAA